ncbi:very short patch repair endonuclease [Bradyrhizobium sp. AZCC 1719]|uniref:very short patch repair endonuclease n=1 Tax=Bradyrhizobium sp. AZCC 1719 TaxID=3117028 RepID=UPI002FEF9EA0
MDVLTPAQRQLNMSRIRGRNTKPELLVRSALHAMGFRFRIHVRTLPGSPDLVLRKYNVAIFVNGCFWHGHGCHLSKLPATRTEFWRTKISDTCVRDSRAIQQLHLQGWRVIVLWECSIRAVTPEGLIRTWARLRTAICASKSRLVQIPMLKR